MPKLGHLCRMAHAGLGTAFALCVLVWAYPAPAQEATTEPTCTGCSRGQKAKRSKPDRPARAPKAAARSAVNNEGAWTGVSTGPCIVTWRWSLNVGNGAISGRNVTGQVARGGAIRGTMVVFGKSYRFVGHMNGSTGIGTWKSEACSGTWTSTKS